MLLANVTLVSINVQVVDSLPSLTIIIYNLLLVARLILKQRHNHSDRSLLLAVSVVFVLIVDLVVAALAFSLRDSLQILDSETRIPGQKNQPKRFRELVPVRRKKGSQSI